MLNLKVCIQNFVLVSHTHVQCTDVMLHSMCTHAYHICSDRSIMVKVEKKCQHDIVVFDMCADCGLNLKK